MDPLWIIVIAVVLIGWVFLSKMRSGGVSEGEARAALRRGATLVDVREPSEFAAGHLDGAINLPLGTLPGSLADRDVAKQGEILCYCQSGIRSGNATRILKSAGYENVANLGSLSKARQIVGQSKR